MPNPPKTAPKPKVICVPPSAVKKDFLGQGLTTWGDYSEYYEKRRKKLLPVDPSVGETGVNG